MTITPRPLAARVARALLALALVTLGLTGCGTLRPCSDARDPLEPLNRPIFAANEVVDAVVLDPLAQAYVTVVPEPARDGLHAILENARRPASALQHALRLDFVQAGHSLLALVIDTTIGVAGLRRSAVCMGIDDRPAGFADTLAGWGAVPGSYVVLPLLGPATARGAAGRVVDIVANPLRHALTDDARVGFVAARVLDRQSRSLERRHGQSAEESSYDAVRNRVLERATTR